MNETSSSEEEIVAVDDDEATDDEEDDDQSSQNELDAWHNIHEHLTAAVAIAREAVAAKKLQRRYWMEEICANLTEEGKLTQTSVWRRPVPPKKSALKKAAKQREAAARKRKKMAQSKQKRTKTKKTEEDNEGEEEERPKAKKIRLKLKPAEETVSPVAVASDHDSQETSDEEDEESGSEADVANAGDFNNDVEASAHSDYAGNSWEASQHDYMASGSAFGSPDSSGSPFGSGMHDQFSGFYGGGMQAGLSSQGMVSTFAGPPTAQAESEEDSSSEIEQY